MLRKSKQSGFTLVEIAIVLVIIGLLLGGVLKGQELMKNAQVKNYKNVVDSVMAGYTAYMDRYRVLPGDHAEATARLVDNAGQPIVGVVNGNGSGLVDGSWAAISAADRGVETVQFFAHMYASGLLKGNANATTASALRPVGPRSEMFGVGYGVNGLGGLNGCFQNTSGELAELADMAFDDGRPGTGSWRIANTAAAHAAPTYAAFAAAYRGTTYSMCTTL